MAHYRAVGRLPRQRHTQLRDDDGHLFREELMGEEGFSSDSSLLYRRGVPSAITDSTVWELADQSRTPNHPLKPRHLKLHDLETGTCPVEGRRLVLGNNDVRIAYVVTGTDPSPLYRNAIGDECVYVESGTRHASRRSSAPSPTAPATTWSSRAPPTTAGCRPSRRGSTPSRPTATSTRPSATSRASASCSSTRPTASATSTAPRASTSSSRAAATSPTSRCSSSTAPVPGIVGTRMTYATHPFDVVGWDGCLYPYTFNIEDYMPITGKVHQPPPVHQVFEGWNFVVCNFLPRKVDYHELAIPVPYYHSNVDSDEVMFYVGGDYEARKGSGINVGSISLHPGGHAHGPQPSAIEASLGAEFFDESAVMVDTFAPLELGEGGLAAEDPAYAWTWAGRGPDADGDDGGPAVFSNS